MSRSELTDCPPMLTCIDRASIGEHKQDAHHQTQSPLFSKLPLDIRTLIWTYCVLAYKNLDNPYPTDVPWYRPPDLTHYLNIDTSILQTCRAVYNESRHLPASVNTIVIWQCDSSPRRAYDDDDIVLDAIVPDRSTVYKLKFRSMVIMRAARALSLHASRLHVIADQFCEKNLRRIASCHRELTTTQQGLEQWLKYQQEYLPYHINTRDLKITLRRCGWWGCVPVARPARADMDADILDRVVAAGFPMQSLL